MITGGSKSNGIPDTDQLNKQATKAKIILFCPVGKVQNWPNLLDDGAQERSSSTDDFSQQHFHERESVKGEASSKRAEMQANLHAL